MADDNKLSANAQKIMDMVKELSVLELSKLVKALEEEFGVSAAAPVMMGGAMPAAGDAPVAETKSNYDVVIVSPGDQKIAVIKAIRELDQSLGLAEAKEKAEKADSVILANAKKDIAEEAKKKLETAGAKVELR